MIRDVHAGLRRIPAEVAVSMAEYHAIDDLSEREVEVLRSAASGRSNKLIGAHLAISEDTVKAHMKHIMAKLGASDRTHAVLIAMKRGFLDGISLSGNLPC
jgi:DNA-binding NarL/FixJ family response regulator